MSVLRILVTSLVAVLAFFCCQAVATAQDGKANSSADAAELSAATCPIVYPVDQDPSERGFHYIFYGNGFFINKEGYLLTAAHVLSQLNDAQPYIVLRLPMAPPRLLKATLVAIDRDHDVALLRATPNPFEGKYQVRFLPLAIDRPMRAQGVLAAALRPSRLGDPHTFDAFVEDRPAGEVVDYEFAQLDKGRAETELLLFDHEVLLGDSGAPVVFAESKGVVGLVEGRWLRPNAGLLANAASQAKAGVAAVVPIHYAIALLQQQGIVWHSAQELDAKVRVAAGSAKDFSAPVPLSLVAASRPSQTLGGGEVVLDALVDRNGQLEDIRVVRGASPFLEKVLSAVQTWSFLPAHANGEAVASRIGILFQFAQPVHSAGSKPMHRYEEPFANAPERGASPLLTMEPEVAATSSGESTVILKGNVDARGELTSLEVIRDVDSLGPSIAATVRQWQFVPAKQGDAECDSEVIVVILPRRTAAPNHAQSGARTPFLVQ
jgi:TonB family protein